MNIVQAGLSFQGEDKCRDNYGEKNGGNLVKLVEEEKFIHCCM